MPINTSDSAQHEKLSELRRELDRVFTKFLKETGSALKRIDFKPRFYNETGTFVYGSLDVETVKQSDTIGFYEYYLNGTLEKISK